MPEIPDFEQIARDLLFSYHPEALDPLDVAEQLRQVWNARGAADLDAIDAAVAYGKEGLVIGARHQIARAIRDVDR